MKLRAVRTSSLALAARGTSSLALRAKRERTMIRFGFESDETWGTAAGMVISTDRARSGVASIKYPASPGAVLGAFRSATFGDDVRDMEFRVWVYLDRVPTDTATTPYIEVLFNDALTNDVTFRVSLVGVAAGEWVELSTLRTAMSATPPSGINTVTLTARVQDDADFIDAYFDDMSFSLVSGPLQATQTSTLALKARQEPKVVQLGFESDEAWGSATGNASLSTTRAHSGTTSLKINAGTASSMTLAKTVGPSIEEKVCTLWVYAESASTASIIVGLTAAGVSVSFTLSLSGVATGQWVKISTPVTAQSGILPAEVTSILVLVIGAPAPVVYIDDISFSTTAGKLRARRTS